MFQANRTFADIAMLSQFAFDVATYTVEVDNIAQVLAVSFNISDYKRFTFIK